MVSRDKLDTKDTDQGMEARQHSRGRRVGGDRLSGRRVKCEAQRGRS